jgi:hypothetical protein
VVALVQWKPPKCLHHRPSPTERRNSREDLGHGLVSLRRSTVGAFLSARDLQYQSHNQRLPRLDDDQTPSNPQFGSEFVVGCFLSTVLGHTMRVYVLSHLKALALKKMRSAYCVVLTLYRSCPFRRRTCRWAGTQLGLPSRIGILCPQPFVDSTVAVNKTAQ